jgi:hypothetical protein
MDKPLHKLSFCGSKSSFFLIWSWNRSSGVEIGFQEQNLSYAGKNLVFEVKNLVSEA